MKTDIQFLSYLARFFLEWEMFQTNFVEKIKIHILCSITFFRKTFRLWENVGRYWTEGERHRRKRGACSTLAGYLKLQIHTLRICNIHCFSTATMVARSRLIVTLYAQCLSCLNVVKSTKFSVLLKFQIFWDVTPCRLVTQFRQERVLHWLTLKKKTLQSLV
jgi:hypothetical protein